MYNLLENIFISRDLYQAMIAPVCDKYDMTQAEMIVLLFLANNPQSDTATDIVEKRRMTKSAVSMAARALQEKGLITGEYTGGNPRPSRSRWAACGSPTSSRNRPASSQDEYLKILTKDFSESERTAFKDYIMRVTDNIKHYNELFER